MKKAKQTDIQSRIIRAPIHRDGSLGLLYLRVRVEQADSRLRPVRVDLPLCTASRDEAAARACFIVYALRALGVGVIGDFPLPRQIAPCRGVHHPGGATTPAGTYAPLAGLPAPAGGMNRRAI